VPSQPARAGQHVLRNRNGVIASGGRMQRAGRPIEKLEPKRVLHLLDQEADRRLGDAQFGRSLCQAAEPVDQDQGFELTQCCIHEETS